MIVSLIILFFPVTLENIPYRQFLYIPLLINLYLHQLHQMSPD